MRLEQAPSPCYSDVLSAWKVASTRACPYQFASWLTPVTSASCLGGLASRCFVDDMTAGGEGGGWPGVVAAATQLELGRCWRYLSLDETETPSPQLPCPANIPVLPVHDQNGIVKCEILAA